MKQIPFLRRFVDPILSGRKTATIRDETRSTPMVGETVSLTFRRKAFASAVVLDVERIALASIDQRIADLEGGVPVDELRRHISERYGEKPLVLIRFELTH